MTRTPSETDYPIAAVSRLTGVSCHSLRVWERRYGFPVPHRSPAGHRRYDHAQVQLIRSVAARVFAGRPIGEVVAEVQAGTLPPSAAPEGATPEAHPIVESHDPGLSAFLAYLTEGNFDQGAACFEDFKGRYPPDELVTRVIAPAFAEVGDRWFRRRCSVVQERCVSRFLRYRLDVLIEAARSENTSPKRKIVLGAAQGERHEGGVLAAALLFESVGWSVINLGVDLPVVELARAVAFFRPDALAVSFVLSRNITKRFNELAAIREVPVFVGGRSILNYQSLARRSGLIPVSGGAKAAVALVLAEYEAWRERSRTEGPAGRSN